MCRNTESLARGYTLRLMAETGDHLSTSKKKNRTMFFLSLSSGLSKSLIIYSLIHSVLWKTFFHPVVDFPHTHSFTICRFVLLIQALPAPPTCSSADPKQLEALMWILQLTGGVGAAPNPAATQCPLGW